MTEHLANDIAKLLGREPPRRGAMTEMLHRRRSNKDTTPHHFTAAQTLPAQERPMQEILNAADRSLDDGDTTIDHYAYLRDADTANADLTGRLRHRATLMRQCADELDAIADEYTKQHLPTLETAVRSYDEIGVRILRLLEKHKHAEPTRTKV